MRRKFPILLMCWLTLSARPGWTVLHVNPKAYPNAHQDKMHHPTADQIRAHGTIQAALASGSTGPKNIAVIIVQFPAGNPSLISGSRSVQSSANIQTYFTQMKNYYNEVSFGKITLNFAFMNSNNSSANGDPAPSGSQTGVYLMSHPMEYYGCGDEGVGCSGVTTPAQGANGNYMARDALLLARPGHANLDTSHFDALIIIHAGNGNETTLGTNGDIWSIFYSDDPGQPIIQSGGGGFTEADVDPETETDTITSPLGVMCHEFGHSLGLPDLYNTSAVGGSSVVGKWEIMDSGPYAGPPLQGGTNPSHMGAWDKLTLGWLTPSIGTSKLVASLGYVETTASALKIPVQNGLAQEYFLVEYRSHAATGAIYDHFIPGDGLLVWHIDDAITSSRGINATGSNIPNSVNIGSPHYGVSIVSADGASVGSSGGSSGNPFTNGAVFSSPKSDNFSGQPSGISIVNISGVGSGAVSLQVANLEVTPGQSITHLTNYPNPAGKGYAHPSGPMHSTIQMQLTRPANDFGFNIYTLSGDLVRKIGRDEITLNVDRSSDDKWVYEYVWDLKNGDGAMVAPGVYLYLARADGQTAKGKAVVIR